MMTKKERCILQVVLMHIGLKVSQANNLIYDLEKRGMPYEKVLKSITKIEKITNYFQTKNYNPISINKILCEAVAGHRSKEKIIRIDNVILANNYSNQETEKIERDYPKVFEAKAETLDKKLIFYNDIDHKDQIMDNPRRLKQPLDISYARFKFLSTRNLKLKGNLFMLECTFKDNFGIWNNEIIEKYPIKEERYLVKK